MWQNYGGSYDHDTDLTYEYIRAKGGDIHEHIKPLRGTSNCEETVSSILGDLMEDVCHTNDDDVINKGTVSIEGLNDRGGPSTRRRRSYFDLGK